LDGIQLHGDEEPAIVDEIRSKLSENGQHCFLIRAIRSIPKELASSSDSKQQIAKLSAEIASWVKVGVDVILLDAAMPGEYGGTGKLVDITNIPNLNSKVPVVLAGGLTPSNVEGAIQGSGLSAVDVASGVESAPGLKDRKKVREFVQLAMKSFQEMK
jgi:phosphoribosylanthranilate isomerase